MLLVHPVILVLSNRQIILVLKHPMFGKLWLEPRDVDEHVRNLLPARVPPLGVLGGTEFDGDVRYLVLDFTDTLCDARVAAVEIERFFFGVFFLNVFRALRINPEHSRDVVWASGMLREALG